MFLYLWNFVRTDDCKVLANLLGWGSASRRPFLLSKSVSKDTRSMLA